MGLLRPASTRSFSTRSRATCRWISRLTRCSPIRASSSASRSSRLRGGGAGGRRRLASGWAAAVGAAHDDRLGRRVARRAGRPPAPGRRHGRWCGGPHDRQLGRRRDRRVADDPHGRLAELAGGRGDLGQRLGVGLRERGPLRGERAEGRGGRPAPATAPARGVEEVLGAGAAHGDRPVGGGPRRRLGDGGGEVEGLGPGGHGVDGRPWRPRRPRRRRPRRARPPAEGSRACARGPSGVPAGRGLQPVCCGGTAGHRRHRRRPDVEGSRRWRTTRTSRPGTGRGRRARRRRPGRRRRRPCPSWRPAGRAGR